jgi:flavin-dependent dehydrogenase
MRKSWLVSLLEDRLNTKPLQPAQLSPEDARGLPDGATVAVLGAGIAGPAFVRRLMSLAAQCGRQYNIVVLTKATCNYCAGLVTELSRRSMEAVYGIDIPAFVIKSTISEFVYVNPHGQVRVELEYPITSVLRSGRFAQAGFDDTLKDMVEDAALRRHDLTLHRGAAVREILPGERGGRTLVRYFHEGRERELEADLAVIATGLKSLPTKLMREFIARTGYRPPTLIPAWVTEIDSERAIRDQLAGTVMVVDNTVPGCVSAIVPKGPNWITAVGLGASATVEDLERLFAHPAVRERLEIPDVARALRCRMMCDAPVFVRPARHYYGDGWVMIGDLTGTGRILKDGYFAALRGADLAARTIVEQGVSRRDFAAHYRRPLAKLSLDNRIGYQLFKLNQRWGPTLLGRLAVWAATKELRRRRYGGLASAAFRALFTGEISYKWTLTLFALGVLRGMLPWSGRPQPVADQSASESIAES